MIRKRQQWSVRPPAAAETANEILELYYARLIEWGCLLAHGDRSKVHDLVHDFCLHLAITKPDLSSVENLDNYLYKSLRHVYLSSLARSSREALHFVSTADFDSFQLALTPQLAGDPLQRQNDLRRICAYSVWRKANTKGANYFVLRYFHGYHLQEIATLACSPTAAIYNKSRAFRVEVRSFLEQPGKSHFIHGELPSMPALRWAPVGSLSLFRELRQIILTAQTGECLPEDQLLAPYKAVNPKPISCSRLSHIVSCERCLALIDHYLRRPTLKDREPLEEENEPAEHTRNDLSKNRTTDLGRMISLPQAGTSSEENEQRGRGPGRGNQNVSRKRLQRSIESYRAEFLEHRPIALSIAVDGRTVASHDVQAQRSILSARTERPENARFVEVFSEQGIRLALLSIEELPPDGPHFQMQRVALSDDRWLDLRLSFDGQGLKSEVVYFDPVLAAEWPEEEDAEQPQAAVTSEEPQTSHSERVLLWPRLQAAVRAASQRLLPAVTSPGFAWSLISACGLCAAGIYLVGPLAHRGGTPATVLQARDILDHSMQSEAASLTGKTAHQVLRFEEANEGGGVTTHGMIDVWKDGNGARSLRRLYDAKHRLIAAVWTRRDGEHGEFASRQTADRELLAGGLWKQDVTPSAFKALGGKNMQLNSEGEEGYELNVSWEAPAGGANKKSSVQAHGERNAEGALPDHGSGPKREDVTPRIVSATLRIDRHNHALREQLVLQSGLRVREARLTEVDYSLQPTSAIADSVFDPHLRPPSQINRQAGQKQSGLTDLRLAQLQVAVLYQLNGLAADTSELIEVNRVRSGRLRVAGTVADEARKQEILARLNLLPGHELLDIEVLSPADLRKQGGKAKTSRGFKPPLAMVEVGETRVPADALVRDYFMRQGQSGDALDGAVIRFCRGALAHSQRALQHAASLKRLSDLSFFELSRMALSSRQQWTHLAAVHATGVADELRALRDELTQLSPGSHRSFGAPSEPHPENALKFTRQASQLLAATQNLHHQTVGLFAMTDASTQARPEDVQSLVSAMEQAIPLEDATELANQALLLDSSGGKASLEAQPARTNKQSPDSR